MKDVNMTEGKITSSILLFTLPLMAANLLQVLYNTADSVVLSWFSGNTAYSAVGATTAVIAFLVNFVVAMSAGANLIIARYLGARDDESLSHAIHTAVTFSLAVGILLLAVGQILSMPLLRMTDCPEELLPGAELYMRIYFLGTPALLFYNFASPVLRSKGDTRRPLIYLAVSGAVNVVLNVLFVVGFGRSVDGVAIATVVSQYLSAGMLLARLLRLRDNCRLHLSRLRIHGREMFRILRYGLPSAISTSMYSISNLQIQSAVNAYGTVGTAGNAASLGVENIYNAVYSTLALAAVAFVGQNIGAGNRDRVCRIFRTFLWISLGITVVVTASALLFGRDLLYIYLPDAPEAIDFGMVRLYNTAGLAVFAVVNNVLGGTLQGFGKNSLHMLSTIAGVCGTRILWMFFVYLHFMTPEMLYISYPASWAFVTLAETVILTVIFRRYKQGREYRL